MESRVAKQAAQALVEVIRHLTPEERLNAFLVHCQLMMELREAGQRLRSSRDVTQG